MRVAFALCGFAGGVALPTLCILGSMAGLQHYRMPNGHVRMPMIQLSVSENRKSVTSVNITPCMRLMCVNHFMLVYSCRAEVMIGKVFLYLVYAHNQTLPNNTRVDMLAAQHHWCIWFFGAGPYQLLPIVTTSPHAVIGDSGTLETASTKHYLSLPVW